MKSTIAYIDDEDDAILDEIGTIRAIIPPRLTLGTKFNIISTMLPNLKELFKGVARNDPNLYLMKFIEIY